MHPSGLPLPLLPSNRVVQRSLLRFGLFCLNMLIAVLLLTNTGCHRAGGQASSREEISKNGPTDIAIHAVAARTGLKRLGINLAGQNFYDSGQMLKNLVFRNPGFEGEIRRSILRCKFVTLTTCTDGNQWAQWPEDFLKGAQFEFISGHATGTSGVVASSTRADWQRKDQGVTITFATLPVPAAEGDFLVVTKIIPGDAQAGWWVSSDGGAVLSTEFSDLDPNTAGKQALRISAIQGSSTVSSYFDSRAGHSFIQMNGDYRVSFRAKGLGGNNQLRISVYRAGTYYLDKTIIVANHWREYQMDFSAAEDGSATGTASLRFGIGGAEILLDDVSLTPVKSSPRNTTPFRDAVVETLMDLHPGVLRYHDVATYGSTFDNLIAPPFARMRAAYSTQNSRAEDIALGLHEFLELCKTIDAEPYYDVPAAISPKEMKDLIEYLGGDASTDYGKRRAALGQSEPWTKVFPVIHLELGNEQWNYATFPGASINDPVAYGRRISTIYAAARSSPYFSTGRFDLVMGSFVVLPWWTETEIANATNYDSISVAPYLFSNLDDTSSNEAIFGPMFAQPEMLDSLGRGYLHEQIKTVRGAGKNLDIYELQIGTSKGSAEQSKVDAVVPSVAAGLTVADHTLLMMRDLGITTQSVWSLPGYSNKFDNPKDHSETMPLFGTVVDMGGATNLRRTPFLAEQLANRAILPTMLTATLTGANPIWHQPKSANDNIELEEAHFLQVFPFADGRQRSLILFNLSRSNALPVTFSGEGAPLGLIKVSQLTSKNITDSNERSAAVAIHESTLDPIHAGAPYSLPPFSMTVFRWTATH